MYNVLSTYRTGDLANDPNVDGDPFKTLFVGRIVSVERHEDLRHNLVRFLFTMITCLFTCFMSFRTMTHQRVSSEENLNRMAGSKM